MKFFVRSLVAAVLVASPLLAQRATRADAEALVKDAIKFYKAKGKEPAFKAITTVGGPFSKYDGELYVFVYGMDGVVLAHGQGAYRVGENQLKAKDPSGREFVQERIQLAKAKGKGWHDYQYLHPVHKRVENKTSYIEVCDDLIFGAGIYRK